MYMHSAHAQSTSLHGQVLRCPDARQGSVLAGRLSSGPRAPGACCRGEAGLRRLPPAPPASSPAQPLLGRQAGRSRNPTLPRGVCGWPGPSLRSGEAPGAGGGGKGELRSISEGVSSALARDASPRREQNKGACPAEGAARRGEADVLPKMLLAVPAAPLLLLLCAAASPVAPRQPPWHQRRLGRSLTHTPVKEQNPEAAATSSAVMLDSAKGLSSGGTAQQKPPHCGVPDLPTSPGSQNGRNRKKRFVLSGGRWEKMEFTYKIVRFPWQLVKADVRQAIAAALKVWSDVTPLTFTEIHGGEADIVIDFSRYWHGDNLPFDGPGGILAHAFFPKTHREGDVHFDYDETWSFGSNLGTDLLQVAAHEFGHVLGLQHTKVAKSLMSPFYFFRYPLKLSEDDRQGIQYLYGKPKSEIHPGLSQEQETDQPDNMETNEITNVQPAQPDACDTEFDAVSTIRGELFFFKSCYVWRLRNGKLQPGYPALASRHWQEIPTSVDAAFEDSLGNIWFFQGAQYWIYDGEKRLSGPLPTTELGFSASPLQAALVWGTDKNKVYFFKGGGYWRFNPSTHQVDNAHPRRMADWRGVPQEVDATFQDEFGFAYFLKGQQYWKFDPIQVQVLDGYPRLVGHDFFGCTPSSNTFPWSA